MRRLARAIATTLGLAVGSLLKSVAPSMPDHLVQPLWDERDVNADETIADLQLDDPGNFAAYMTLLLRMPCPEEVRES